VNDKTAIVIPARLESTRFPEKMLVPVTDMHCLIQRVEHWCKMVTENVFVATDSKKIAALFPDNHIMTSEEAENGTDRVAEAMEQLPFFDKFINVQGDLIDPPIHSFHDIEKRLDHNRVVTVCSNMDKTDQLDPNSVKCINNNYFANWFLRAPVQYGDWHLGIYGYTRAALGAYKYLNVYESEMIESLEQLRWLSNGFDIGVIFTDEPAAEINTEEDLIKWKEKQ